MGNALNQRWKQAAPPFSGLTVAFASEELTPLPALRQVLLVIFPDDYGFYLRVYVPAHYDNDYPERRGSFDVTCAPELAAELAEIVASASRLPVSKFEAKAFFDCGYGG